MKSRFTLLSVIILAFVAVSCSKEAEAPQEVIRIWDLPLSAKNENPTLTSRLETGKATVHLLSDSTLRYEVFINNLLDGDAIQGATINSGDPLTTGPIVLDLKPKLINSYIQGVINGLRSSFIDSLQNGAVDLYLNVYSTQHPNGLIRGQINSTITMAADVVLRGSEEVPPVTTTATGLASLRLTSDGRLYSRVTVTNLEPADNLAASHIHTGAPGVNGPVIVPLTSSAAEFGVKKITPVASNVYAMLIDPAQRLYVNVHTVLFPAGKIRGQLK